MGTNCEILDHILGIIAHIFYVEVLAKFLPLSNPYRRKPAYLGRLAEAGNLPTSITALIGHSYPPPCDLQL